MKQIRYPHGFLLLGMLILLAYANTFDAPWHLDDIPNILDNQRVHATRLSTGSLLNSLRTPFPESGSTTFYSPLAMLTFALNWYVGQANAFGYRLVNITIHCLNAWLLFVITINLLRAPRLNRGCRNRAVFVALTAAALWALHPIQTQAVTYIVQRVVSLATLFFLCSIYCYVKGRWAKKRSRRYLFYTLCLIGYGLALGTRQSAIVLPVVLFVIEVVFFVDPDSLESGWVRWLLIAVGVGLAASLLLVLVRWAGNPLPAAPDAFMAYPFSLSQSILTGCRVLVFHLGQIFYPIPQQFSILHDVKASASLWLPWTTLPAVIVVGILIVLALMRCRRHPVLSFAILFFFVGHAAESFLPASDIILEHRNYMPTLFFFLPLATGLNNLATCHGPKNTVVHGCVVVFLPLLILGLLTATFTRNLVWASPERLWMDAAQKAPAMARPYQQVAKALEKQNRWDDALNLYKRSLQLQDSNPQRSRFTALSGMGNIYKQKGDYVQAVNALEAAVKIPRRPDNFRVEYNLILCMLNTGQAAEALNRVDRLLAKQPGNMQFMIAKGFLLQLHGLIPEARKHFQVALQQNPADWRAMYHLGMALSGAGNYQRADWFLRRARNKAPMQLGLHFGLLQNGIAMQHPDRISEYLTEITDRFELFRIASFFAERAKGHHLIDGMLVLLADDMILRHLADHLEESARMLDTHATGKG